MTAACTLNCPHCGALVGLKANVIILPQSDTVRRSAKGRFGLLPKEAEVVDFVVEGLGDREIAARMEIKYQVVRNYVSKALMKVGATSRVEMVRIVLIGRNV